MKSNTIAAIATPMTNSGIGIIRISGDEALDIIEKVFKPKKKDKKIKDVKTYTAHYGHVYDESTLLDECIVLVMKGPHSYTAEDVVDGKVREQALPAFRALIGKLTHPDLSIHNYFAYKTIGDSKNTEDTEKYLVQLEEKVKEIIPVIRNAKSIAEITNYGVAEQPKDSATMIGGAKASDILKDSAPSELASSILNDAPEPNAETPAPVGNQTVNDILNA